jgi:GNAT superfamily N-acetyltransferase
MINIRKLTTPQGPQSQLIEDLVRVFCAAREERLRFLMDLHDAQEDRHYLSSVVLPANQFWVAEIDGGIAGFIAFADGWVNHLYVDPRLQRQGIGARLLEIAKESTTVLQLWVFEVNAPAIDFYRNRGFRIIMRTDGAANEAKMPDFLMEWKA